MIAFRMRCGSAFQLWCWSVFLLLAAGCGDDEELGDPIAVEIQGSVSYEDRLYDPDGFTGAIEQKPIQAATVQLVDSDSGEVLSSTRSTPSGSFLIQATVEENREVHVVLSALAIGRYEVLVTNRDRQIYALGSASFRSSTAPSEIRLLAGVEDLGGAFNIFAQLIAGADFVLSLEPNTVFPELRATWYPEQDETTRFSPADNEILLLGIGEDPDEYDDDVILHEFGHYVEYNFGQSSSPGGPHNPFDLIPEPPELAWSEGYATWVSCRIRETFTYVDNYAGGRLLLDLELPSAADITRGPGNEIAVAAILWDISDEANESHDHLSLLQEQVWDVASRYFLMVLPVATLDAFCHGWFARGHGRRDEIALIFDDRSASCGF